MISSDISTAVPTEVPQHVSLQTRKRIFKLHHITWICLFLACVGASWFSYQCFLVPQPKSFAPNWQGARWVQASDGNAPVAYFRSITDLNVLPDAAFLTVAANQVFRLYVNGTFFGSNALDFAEGSFPRAYMYDVAPALQLGSNVLALRVANIDTHTPAVRVSFGIVWGQSVTYYGTGRGWQATSQSVLVYPQYASNVNAWTTNNFDASAWLPAENIASLPLSPMLKTNPAIYTQPSAMHWMGAGVGHEAYFVRQLSLPIGITGAWLRITAAGTASVFINGHLLMLWKAQPLLPQQDVANYLSNTQTVEQYPTGLVVGIYDISPYLQAGVNTIAVHVSAPGVSASLAKLATLNAAMSLDVLITSFQGHNTWLTSDVGWHASNEPVDDWAQASDAALRWPLPVSLDPPSVSYTFSLPDSNTAQSIQFIPPSLIGEVILFSIGVVLGLWLLMSLVVMRRYYYSRSSALEIMSLAYLPAVACEAMLVVLSREPQIPQPFPYTWAWGVVLIALVGMSYLLLWWNARTAHTHPRVLLSGQRRVRHYTWGRILAWIRSHWAILLLVLIAIPFICYNLSYEPYWQDELASYNAARGVLAHGLPFFPSGFLYTKAELYSYVLALWTTIFGDQGGIPRSISVVEYLISLPLLYKVGCYFFERRVALLATAMLAFSPIAFVWGRQMRMYEQAQLLTLLALYLFYKALQDRHRVHLVYLAVLCLVADYLSHEEVFITLPAIVICILVVSRDATHRIPAVLRQKHWWYAAAIGGSIIALQLLIVYVARPPLLGTDQSERPFIQLTTDNIPFYIDLLFFPKVLQYTVVPWITIKPWLTLNSLLAVAGCVWAISHRDTRAKYCALFLLISLLSLVFLFTMEADRYIYPILPIYYLMGAYALLMGLRAIWAFARLHLIRQGPSRITMPALGGYVSKPIRIMATFTVSLVCACVLLLPVLPISDYNLFLSRLVGFSYHRHYPDYDVVGQYMQQHWRKGDIVITVAPAVSILYYVGHVDYFFSIDRALFVFEQNGHSIDTASGAQALFDQQDFQAVLATHGRIWIISDNGVYQAEVAKRFVFPPDFHIVYEGYGSAVYFRGT